MSESETGENALLRQQDILAKFGELALRSEDLDEILTEACRLISEALGTDLAKVLELQDDGVTLFMRAGVGWKPGLVGKMIINADKDSSEGYALQTGHPVTSDNIDEEDRFKYADFLRENGVVALVNVAIKGREKPSFGILQVDSRSPRRFGERDTNFLKGYANLLAAAVDRLHVAETMRNVQAELKASELRLSQSNKLEAIGQLTGGVAHDFNNLLTIIRGATDFLRRKDTSEDRRERYIEAISLTVDRASKLTGQLLAFARRQSLKPETFDVGQQVRVVIDLVGSLLGSRITIHAHLCDPPCFTKADVSQFDTALVNLAVNARDAMSGEGCLDFKIEEVGSVPAIRDHPIVHGDFIAVSVTDTGSGIDPNQIVSIFDPFFTTKDVGKGTGLGLSQVIGFAKQSRGDVAVQSVQGQGSTFTLYLPRSAPRQTEDASASTGAAPTCTPDGEGARVLVVEDNEAVGQFATGMLHDLGYRTAWAANAKVALQTLADADAQFDLVFSDVVMPGMNGVELGETIRRLYPSLPVVLTSGYSDVLAEEGRHGFELMHKPYSIDALSTVLRQVLSKLTPN